MRFFMKNRIILFFVILFFSCGDDGPNCPGDITLPVSINPYKPYYNVGDTISISSKFHKLLYDQKTEKYYDASGYRFSPYIELFTIDSSSEYNSYSKINELAIYHIPENNSIFEIALGALFGEYRLFMDTLSINVKLILIKKGFRMLRFGSLSTGDGHLQNNYDFNCNGREITSRISEPNKNNIQLLQNFRTNKRNNWILSDSINRFYNRAGYCFEVR